MPSVFLTAEWRKLIMVQYAVVPEILERWLPPGVSLDLFPGPSGPLCFVSLIGFLFTKVRIKKIAIPFHSTFEEINLRFYVKRTDADGSSRRGVVFIRELVPRHAITMVANTLYEEPYATCPVRRQIKETAQELTVRYDWKYSRTWHSLAVKALPQLQPILPGTIEEFITEHYWGYTARSRGHTAQYQVEHPRWQTYPILAHTIAADFGELYGPAFAHLTQQQPHSILLAEGSPVSIFGGTRLPA